MVDAKSALRRLVFLLIAVGVFLAVYSPALRGPFLYDDRPSVLNNEAIRIERLSLRSLWDAATAEKGGGRPLGNLSFALNYYLGGLNTPGYHLFGVLLHLLAAGAVYALGLFFLKKYGRGGEAGALALTALWALNPVQVQSVAYIVQRTTLLAGGLCLWALYLHLVASAGRGRGAGAARAGSLFLYLLALLSKETAVLLPLMILLAEWALWGTEDPSESEGERFLNRRRMLRIGLYVLPALAAAAIYLHNVQREAPDLLPTAGQAEAARRYRANEELTTAARWAAAPRILTFYASLCLFPAPSRLAIEHDLDFPEPPGPPAVALSWVFLALVAAYLFRCRRRRPLVVAAVLWFALLLLPESLFLKLQPVFEHRLYLPSLGFAVLAFAALEKFPRVGRRDLAAWIAVALMALGSFLRSGVWADEIGFWRDAVRKAPFAPRTNNNLIFALSSNGKRDEALAMIDRTLKIDPGDVKALINLGLIREQAGDAEGAVQAYKRAIRARPTYANSYHHLGMLLFRQGRIDEAIKNFKKAVELRPELYRPYRNLGNAYAAKGRWAEAIGAYRKAIELRPNDPASRGDLASALQLNGETRQALREYRRYVELLPDTAEGDKKKEQVRRLIEHLEKETH